MSIDIFLKKTDIRCIEQSQESVIIVQPISVFYKRRGSDEQAPQLTATIR